MKNLLRYLAFVLMVGGAFAQKNLEIEKQKTNASLLNSTIYVFMDTNYGAVVSRYNLKVAGVEMPQIYGYKYLEFIVPTGQYLIEADRTDIGGTSVTLKVGSGEKHYVFVDPEGFPRPKPILRIVDEVRGKEGVSKSVELVIPEKNQKVLEEKGVFLTKNLLNNSLFQLANPIAKPILNDSAEVQQPTSLNIELERLRAEAEEAKKKQAELEIKLRVAQQDKLLAEAVEARKKQAELEIKLRVAQQDKLLAEAVEARKKQAELEIKLRVAQQDKLLAEAVEARKKQAELEIKLRVAQQDKLLAEAEESKRKQAGLEERLRLAQQQATFEVTPSSPLITIANRRALVIGNDSYTSVAKLLNAREDARTIASNLTSFGYQVTLKLDLNEKEMKAAMRNFAGQVQGGDEVMFFFAGHGVQLGSTNYLLPTDIGGESEAQVRDESIQLQRILDDMSERKAKFTLAIIDACRDNPFKSSGRAIGGRGLAPTTAATGQMVIFSAGTGQQALDKLNNADKNKNGLFTRVLVQEMQKPSQSIDRVVKIVRNQVAELAKSVGHEQVPAIYDQVLGDFYFKK